MEKHRILQLCDSPFVGGPEKQILGLCTHVDSSRLEFTVASFTPRASGGNDLIAAARGLGLATAELSDGKLAFPAAVSALCSLLRQTGVSLVVSHGFKANFAACCASALTGVPYVSYFHGRTGATARGRLYERLDVRAMRRALAVVAVCEPSARELRGGGVREVTVIPNAIDVAAVSSQGTRKQAREQLNLSQDDIAVGVVGRLSVEKGHTHLLDAAKLVLAEQPHCRFIIIGDGPVRQSLERQAAGLRIGDRVTFAGFRNDAVALMKALDVYVLPSLSENMPVSLLEAMACGIAVVATNVGGVRDVLAPAGVEPVPPGSAEPIARATMTLAADDLRRAKMGAALKQRAGDFTFERQSKLFEGLLCDLLGINAPDSVELSGH